IAEHITNVGRGQAQPMVVTSDISFPADYQISKQACQQAFKKALAREPALEVEELRKLDTERCEEMYLSLQPATRKGDPPAVAVGVKVLSHGSSRSRWGISAAGAERTLPASGCC